MTNLNQDLCTISMLDALGSLVHLNEWVAFYKSENGKTLFGKIIEFNTSSMVIQLNGKSGTVRKNSNQVVKVPTDIMEGNHIIITDAIGVEIKVGDWVMATTGKGGYGYCYSRYNGYNGRVFFGEITNIKNSSIEILLKNKKTPVKKLPNQVLKVSEGQLILQWLGS